MVQNVAARVLTCTRNDYHISPILASLHWLPIYIRLDLKVLLMTYKSIHAPNPSYMSDLIIPYIPHCALCSQNSELLTVPRVKKKSAGCRASSSGITSLLTLDNLALLTPLDILDPHNLHYNLYQIFCHCNL